MYILEKETYAIEFYEIHCVITKKYEYLSGGKHENPDNFFRLKRKVTDDLEEKKDLGTKGTKICLTFFCKLQF